MPGARTRTDHRTIGSSAGPTLTKPFEPTDILAAIIRGDRSAAKLLADCAPAELRDAADRHGVLPLVAHRLAQWTVGAALRATFIEEARRCAAEDLVREHELRRCLEGFARAGIPVLVMKGAQLAHAYYERSDLRPRMDSDVLIPAEARSRVDEVLADCGHLPARQLPGDLVMYQAAYIARRESAIVHILDVHWRTANPQVFGTVLPYEEVAKTAVPVPRLQCGARGFSPPHALLLACVHRVAHHFDSDHLIWLYDIHLIASRFDRSEWVQFCQLAAEQGVATVCAQSLRRAGHYFHTVIPTDVAQELERCSHGSAEAATAAYLAHRRRHVEDVLADLRALPTWDNRWQLVRQHLFPPPRYMREVYAPASAAPLTFLYLQRAVRGARKWFAAR